MLASLVLAIAGRTGRFGLYGLAAPLFVLVSATEFIVADSIAGALAGFPDRAGALSALVGAIQYEFGVIGLALVGILAGETPRPMACSIALCGMAALAAHSGCSPDCLSRRRGTAGANVLITKGRRGTAC